jgi:hypothetical protein
MAILKEIHMRRRKLDLEALEDRLVPADFGWTGADHNGEWADANNWNCVKAPGTYPNTFQDTAYLGDSSDTIKYENWNGQTVSGNIGVLDGESFAGTLELFRSLTVGTNFFWGASSDWGASCPILLLQSNDFTLTNNTCAGYWYGGTIGVCGDTGSLVITGGAMLNIQPDGTTTDGATSVFLNVSMQINAATVNVQDAFVDYLANNPIVTVMADAKLNFSGYRDAGNGTYMPYVFGWSEPGATGEMDVQPWGAVEFAPDAYYQLNLGCYNKGNVYIDGANSSDETIADFTGSYPGFTRSFYQDSSKTALTVLGDRAGPGGARLQCDKGFYMDSGWLYAYGIYENNLVCGTTAATNAYFAGGDISLNYDKSHNPNGGLAVLNIYGAPAYMSGTMLIRFAVDPSASYTSSGLYFDEGVTIADGSKITVTFTSITGVAPTGKVYSPVWCGTDASLSGTFIIGSPGYTGAYGPNWFNVSC